MDSPFYRNHWGSTPRYPQSFRSVVPVATSQKASFPSAYKPKVVSIPVQFIQPEDNSCYKPSRSVYATRIQKLWRGFRVRKNVKKLLEIQRELKEVETSILESQIVESIRRDERERLKVTERLMNLLFRLDSIGGFDVAVRDLRRSFIRRAIALQEKVDSITVVVQAENSSSTELNCDNKDSQTDLELEQEEESGPVDLNSIEEAPKPNSATILNCVKQETCSDSDSCSDSESCEADNASLIEEEPEPVERELAVVKEEKTDGSEMLKRMLEDNNKLMTLMADLYDRSEMQTRILSSLSERVEQLENSFACERLWRKMKKQRKRQNSKSLDKKKACWSGRI